MNKYDTYGTIMHDRSLNWNDKWDFVRGGVAYHADTIEMTAGESFNAYVEIFWAAEDLAPHDFSIVVWSTVEPVTLTVLNDPLNINNVHSSGSFPVY